MRQDMCVYEDEDRKCTIEDDCSFRDSSGFCTAEDKDLLTYEDYQQRLEIARQSIKGN